MRPSPGTAGVLRSPESRSSTSSLVHRVFVGSSPSLLNLARAEQQQEHHQQALESRADSDGRSSLSVMARRSMVDTPSRSVVSLGPDTRTATVITLTPGRAHEGREETNETSGLTQTRDGGASHLLLPNSLTHRAIVPLLLSPASKIRCGRVCPIARAAVHFHEADATTSSEGQAVSSSHPTSVPFDFPCENTAQAEDPLELPALCAHAAVSVEPNRCAVIGSLNFLLLQPTLRTFWRQIRINGWEHSCHIIPFLCPPPPALTRATEAAHASKALVTPNLCLLYFQSAQECCQAATKHPQCVFPIIAMDLAATAGGAADRTYSFTTRSHIAPIRLRYSKVDRTFVVPSHVQGQTELELVAALREPDPHHWLTIPQTSNVAALSSPLTARANSNGRHESPRPPSSSSSASMAASRSDERASSDVWVMQPQPLASRASPQLFSSQADLQQHQRHAYATQSSPHGLGQYSSSAADYTATTVRDDRSSAAAAPFAASATAAVYHPSQLTLAHLAQQQPPPPSSSGSSLSLDELQHLTSPLKLAQHRLALVPNAPHSDGASEAAAKPGRFVSDVPVTSTASPPLSPAHARHFCALLPLLHHLTSSSSSAPIAPVDPRLCPPSLAALTASLSTGGHIICPHQLAWVDLARVAVTQRHRWRVTPAPKTLLPRVDAPTLATTMKDVSAVHGFWSFVRPSGDSSSKTTTTTTAESANGFVAHVVGFAGADIEDKEEDGDGPSSSATSPAHAADAGSDLILLIFPDVARCDSALQTHPRQLVGLPSETATPSASSSSSSSLKAAALVPSSRRGKKVASSPPPVASVPSTPLPRFIDLLYSRRDARYILPPRILQALHSHHSPPRHDDSPSSSLDPPISLFHLLRAESVITPAPFQPRLVPTTASERIQAGVHPGQTMKVVTTQMLEEPNPAMRAAQATMAIEAAEQQEWIRLNPSQRVETPLMTTGGVGGLSLAHPSAQPWLLAAPSPASSFSSALLAQSRGAPSHQSNQHHQSFAATMPAAGPLYNSAASSSAAAASSPWSNAFSSSASVLPSSFPDAPLGASSSTAATLRLPPSASSVDSSTAARDLALRFHSSFYPALIDETASAPQRQSELTFHPDIPLDIVLSRLAIPRSPPSSSSVALDPSAIESANQHELFRAFSGDTAAVFACTYGSAARMWWPFSWSPVAHMRRDCESWLRSVDHAYRHRAQKDIQLSILRLDGDGALAITFLRAGRVQHCRVVYDLGSHHHHHHTSRVASAVAWLGPAASSSTAALLGGGVGGAGLLRGRFRLLGHALRSHGNDGTAALRPRMSIRGQPRPSESADYLALSDVTYPSLAAIFPRSTRPSERTDGQCREFRFPPLIGTITPTTLAAISDTSQQQLDEMIAQREFSHDDAGHAVRLCRPGDDAEFPYAPYDSPLPMPSMLHAHPLPDRHAEDEYYHEYLQSARAEDQARTPKGEQLERGWSGKQARDQEREEERRRRETAAAAAGRKSPRANAPPSITRLDFSPPSRSAYSKRVRESEDTRKDEWAHQRQRASGGGRSGQERTTAPPSTWKKHHQQPPAKEEFQARTWKETLLGGGITRGQEEEAKEAKYSRSSSVSSRPPASQSLLARSSPQMTLEDLTPKRHVRFDQNSEGGREQPPMQAQRLYQPTGGARDSPPVKQSPPHSQQPPQPIDSSIKITNLHPNTIDALLLPHLTAGVSGDSTPESLLQLKQLMVDLVWQALTLRERRELTEKEGAHTLRERIQALVGRVVDKYVRLIVEQEQHDQLSTSAHERMVVEYAQREMGVSTAAARASPRTPHRQQQQLVSTSSALTGSSSPDADGPSRLSPSQVSAVAACFGGSTALALHHLIGRTYFACTRNRLRVEEWLRRQSFDCTIIRLGSQVGLLAVSFVVSREVQHIRLRFDGVTNYFHLIGHQQTKDPLTGAQVMVDLSRHYWATIPEMISSSPSQMMCRFPPLWTPMAAAASGRQTEPKPHVPTTEELLQMRPVRLQTEERARLQQ